MNSSAAAAVVVVLFFGVFFLTMANKLMLFDYASLM